MQRTEVYLDHNASTPVRREVFEAMRPYLELTPAANASSPHRAGQRARLAIEEAREQVARLAGAEAAEVVFTSGGTEANNLALLGCRTGSHVVASAIEHPSVEECLKELEAHGVSVSRVRPGPDGRIDADCFTAQFRPETGLCTVMLANNETGVIQPVDRIAESARARGILVHCDAVQAAGRIPCDVRVLGVDFLTMSAHKMEGPQGSGALVVRRGVDLSAKMLGGPQERRRRGGTEPVAAIVGFGQAALLAREELSEGATSGEKGRWVRVTEPLRDRFEREVLARWPEARIHGRSSAMRLPNTSSVAFLGRTDPAKPPPMAESVVMGLDLSGIEVSTGSACSSGATLPSRTLQMMGLPEEEVRRTIRVSFGPENVLRDVEMLIEALERVLGTAVSRDPSGTRENSRPLRGSEPAMMKDGDGK